MYGTFEPSGQIERLQYEILQEAHASACVTSSTLGLRGHCKQGCAKVPQENTRGCIGLKASEF